MNPDTWMNQYVDTDLALEYLMNCYNVFIVLILGHGMNHAFHVRRKSFLYPTKPFRKDVI